MASVRFKSTFLIALLSIFQLLSVLLLGPVYAQQKGSQFGILTGTVILDLYTNEGGTGTNASGGLFYPGNEIIFYTTVTYSGEGVADVLVSYEIMNPLDQVLVCSAAITDYQGIAKINLTIPSAPDEGVLGTWVAVATTSVAQIFAGDRLTFQVLEARSPILGDINGDGVVDISDVTLLVLW